jgi:GTP cyclohydrolase I
MCNKFKNVPKTPYLGTKLSNQEQLNLVEKNFKEILEALGMDLKDDSIQDTPKRVAKMFVNELFTGLKDENFPRITVQENKFNYNSMLIEAGIEVKTVCEHHFQNIVGKAHIAYIPSKKVIGLSKLNRVTEYFCKRPQVQERLTAQVMTCLQEVLECEDVAVVIDARHYCVKMRGVEHPDCMTRTSMLGGKFLSDTNLRNEFFNSIPRLEN